ATNVPPGSSVTVYVQGQMGAVSSATASLSGTTASSSASVSLSIPTNQPCVVSAVTSFIIVALSDGPGDADGDEIERVRVAAVSGGPSHVVLVKRTGREVPASDWR